MYQVLSIAVTWNIHLDLSKLKLTWICSRSLYYLKALKGCDDVSVKSLTDWAERLDEFIFVSILSYPVARLAWQHQTAGGTDDQIWINQAHLVTQIKQTSRSSIALIHTLLTFHTALLWVHSEPDIKSYHDL